MKNAASLLLKYTPLLLGVLILSIGAFFVPWSDVWPYLTKISFSDWLLFIGLGCVFYFARVLRYWLLLRALGSHMRFDRVTIAYFVAQPVSLLPGGEFYRSVMFKKYGNISHKEGIPGVFVQSLTENFGMIVIALVCAIILRTDIVLVLIIVTVLAGLIALIRWHNIRHSHKLLNKLPKVSVGYRALRSFMGKNRELLSGKNFVMLFATSFIAAFAGILILWKLALVYDTGLSIVEASMSFTLPVVIQSVTFLPAGIGANEQSSVGILALFGVGVPIAVAMTIIVRLITLILGVLLGFLAMLIARLVGYKTYSHKSFL